MSGRSIPDNVRLIFRRDVLAEALLELLGRTGDAVSEADSDAVDAVRADLDAFAAELPVADLPHGFWPVSGALLVNLRNILAALDVVADAQPVEVSAPALRAPLTLRR